jgi:GAF domain-containing protein
MPHPSLPAFAPRLQAGGSASEPLFLLYLFILLAALTAAGAILYRRWQSRRELVARLAELSALADVGRAMLGTQLDLARLAEMVYQQAGQIVDTSIFQLGLFKGDRYRMLIWVVDGEPRPPAEFRLTPDSPGIVGWVRAHRESLVVHDFEAERDRLPARPRYISENPPRSAIFVPLFAGEAVLGVLAIQSRRPNAFSEEDVRRVAIVANQAAAALENARLFEQTRQRAAQLQLLAEVSQQINVLQPLPALHRQVVERVAEKFSDHAVSFFENEAAALILRATTRADWQSEAVSFQIGEGVVGEAARDRRPVVVHDLPEYPRDAQAEGLGLTPAELAVPVMIEERVRGVLHVRVAHSGGQAVFDDDAIALFQSLAAQMAFAILEAETYAAEQRRAEQLAALAEAARTVTSSLELDDLLDEVIDLAADRFGYKRAHIFLLQDDHLVFHAGAGEGAVRSSVEGYTLPLDGPGLVARVGRTRQSLLVPDVSAHPDYVPGPGLDDTRTEMAAPMVVGPRLVGVFDVQSEQVNAFTAEDARTLQTLADTLAIAVRNARLFEAERRRRRLAETLREVSTALTSTLHLDDVLDLILDGLARVVNYDAASILLVNDVGELILRATRGGSADMEAALGLPLDIKLFPRGEPLPSIVAFSELDHQSAYHDLVNLPDPHACLGAVLALQGEHLGYLVVDRAGQTRFPRGEVELIAAFAAQAAVAIANARLYTAQREQAWVSTALLQVAEATARATELYDVLNTVARLTPMLVGVDRCAVMLTYGDEFVLSAYHRADEKEPPETPALALRPDEWPRLAEMVGAQAPVVIAPDEEMPESFRPLFEGVVILLPLLAKGKIEGALVVGQSPGETPFTTHRIRLIGGIANQAALAVESAMLYQSQQEEAWVSTALLQVAQAVAEQPTLEEGLEMVARLTPMLVGIERAAIYQWDAGMQAFQPSRVVGLAAPDVPRSELAARAEELGVHLHEAGTPSFYFRLPERLARALGMEMCLIWPLWARGDLLGVLIVEPVQDSERRLNILNGIAHQLALAMENARLAREVAQQQRLEREMEVSRDIQASFLPQACPRVPGWEVSAFWRAARLVGGDFYDFIPLRTHHGAERWAIIIADVADKGVPAALFMALARTLLRSVGIGRISPAATLGRVNELILADARADMFVTVFYGVWEPASGRFTYSVGGHNAPVWVSADGRGRTLDGRGMALGVLDGVEYVEHEIHLQPGDLLFFYTDGLTDAVDVEAEEFGMQRLCEVLRATHTLPAQAVIERMEAAVRAHTGAVEAFDDMTMVALKRAPAA